MARVCSALSCPGHRTFKNSLKYVVRLNTMELISHFLSSLNFFESRLFALREPVCGTNWKMLFIMIITFADLWLMQQHSFLNGIYKSYVRISQIWGRSSKRGYAVFKAGRGNLLPAPVLLISEGSLVRLYRLVFFFFSQALSVSLIHIMRSLWVLVFLSAVLGAVQTTGLKRSEMCRMKLNSPFWPIYCVKLGAARGFFFFFWEMSWAHVAW